MRTRKKRSTDGGDICIFTPMKGCTLGSSSVCLCGERGAGGRYCLLHSTATTKDWLLHKTAADKAASLCQSATAQYHSRCAVRNTIRFHCNGRVITWKPSRKLSGEGQFAVITRNHKTQRQISLGDFNAHNRKPRMQIVCICKSEY